MSNQILTNNNSTAIQQIDIAEAERFIKALSPDGVVTFQTFDDSGNGKKFLARIRHGSLHEFSDELVSLNEAGAGIFFMVNQGNGEGRSAKNVQSVRALFLDMDGSPVEPVHESKLPPHIISETSQGRYHAYWLVDEFPLEEFKSAQIALADKFQGDKSVNDLPRVMRIPGFYHKKGIPFQSKILDIQNFEKYTHREMIEFLGTGSRSESPDTNKTHSDSSEKILNGQRNNRLVSIAGVLRNQGLKYEVLEPILQQMNSVQCVPPLDTKEVTNIAESISKYAIIGSNEKMSCLKLAEAVREQQDSPFIYNDTVFRRYQDGHWPAVHEQDIRSEIANLDRPNTASRRTADALTILKDIAYKPDFESSNNLICVENGVLDPFTRELKQFSPDYFLINKLNIEWDPTGRCPLFEQTLNEIFQDHPDKVAVISILQEFIGLCLVPLKHFELMLILVGKGGNGKSLILNILVFLVGKNNISFAMLTRLENAAVRAELQGKLVNISSELSAEATLNTGYLKAIISGEQIEADRKYQPSFSFSPYCKIICATNQLPRLLDTSDGFRRRTAIIQFDRQFKREEQDRYRFEKLKNEAPGILRWAVDGLIRLKSRGYFDIPNSCQELLDSYIREQNSVNVFIDEFTVPDADGKISVKEIHEFYRNWCRGSVFLPVNISNFGRRLSDLGIEQIKSNGSTYRRLSWKSDHENMRVAYGDGYRH